jgi:hypothetical protein
MATVGANGVAMHLKTPRRAGGEFRLAILQA